MTGATTTAPAPAPPPPKPKPPFAVGLRVVTFTDSSRTVQYPGQAPQPRRLVTIIRYPARGPSSRTDVANAAPRRAGGPFPLVIFGHGFAVTPGIYAPLLRAWARAGYVVAAPLFPLGNQNAPGGPNENDLINQPGDMSFLISELLRADGVRGGFFDGLIDPHRIAVSGQSDGGDTALSAAYDSRFLDRRIRAAVILSGAEIPGAGGYDFPAPSPPLLATQGTADTINPPGLTYTFFDAAPSPKYLLTLPGASHLGPYTDEQPQLSIVERVTVAFMNRYLTGDRRALGQMVSAGNVAGVASIQSDP
jgi:dienelactone hydrolase